MEIVIPIWALWTLLGVFVYNVIGLIIGHKMKAGEVILPIMILWPLGLLVIWWEDRKDRKWEEACKRKRETP